MTLWLVVLGAAVVGSGFAVSGALRRKGRRADTSPSSRRRVERIVYAALAVASIVVGLKLLGVW